MRVLVWAIVWLLLLAASGWYLWRCLRRLLRRARQLAAEMAEAERLLTQVQQQAGARHTATPASGQVSELAVFMGVTRAAQEHRATREALRGQRRARRAATLPGWARRVDSGSTRPRKGAT
ncbi:MAG: hypothetical protein ACOYBY_11025 [Dermatophilaceae bacterium]